MAFKKLTRNEVTAKLHEVDRNLAGLIVEPCQRHSPCDCKEKLAEARRIIWEIFNRSGY